MSSLNFNIPPPLAEYERNILNWLKGAVGEGQAILKKEKAYIEMENAKKFVNGEQYPLRSRAISRMTNNRLRKLALETVGALTDVRPIWNYDTYDSQYKHQAETLSKLARAWWRNNQVDRRLQSVLMYSLIGGSGYAYLQWNADLPGGGDFELLPVDPRDVVPIAPVYSDTIQDWQGVAIRRTLPVEAVKYKYPMKAAQIGKSKGSWIAPLTKEGGGLYNVLSSAWSVLTRDGSAKIVEGAGNIDVYYIYVKDNAKNTGNAPVKMGKPGTEWSYDVYPMGTLNPLTGLPTTEDEARLYPRGRFLVCTMDAVLEDGPNPSWHGNFPLVRFMLEPLPWSLLGASIVGDLIPLQNALNEALRGLEDGMSQWIRRGVIADRNAISKQNLEAIDTRKAGLKAYLNNNVAGQGFQVVDGPQFPSWYMQMLEYLSDAMDENSGVRGLKEMAQLKQMPSADTISKYMEALSPLLKVRARCLEIALGELADLLKVGFLQKYDVKRRVEILGPDGTTMEDFDYDPNTMVPDTLPGLPQGPEYRGQRAQSFHKNFKFSVAPNSFLNISHTEQKMLILQMFREQIMDPWSLWEAMDIPNIGEPPAEKVEDRIMAARTSGLMQGPTSEETGMQHDIQKINLAMQLMQLQQQIQMMQAQMGMPPGGPGGQPPQGGPGGPPPPHEGGPPEPGSPAAGGGPGPHAPGVTAGRPPSGQEPPKMVVKSDGQGGQRPVVSESGR